MKFLDLMQKTFQAQFLALTQFASSIPEKSLMVFTNQKTKIVSMQAFCMETNVAKTVFAVILTIDSHLESKHFL